MTWFLDICYFLAIAFIYTVGYLIGHRDGIREKSQKQDKKQ